MELDELKNSWSELGDKLQRNKKLNERLIKEILKKKSGKALNRLLNFEFLGIIIMLLITPLMVWLWGQPRFENTYSPKILFTLVIIHTVLVVIFQGKRVWELMKVDFSNKIAINVELINHFIIKIKKEKQITLFLIAPVYYLLGILSYYELHANLSLWIFLVVAFVIGILGSYWQYKRVYDNNIQSIQKSLEELKDLEETEDYIKN